MRRTLGTSLTLGLAAPLLALVPGPAPAAVECNPRTAPTYAGEVPTGEEVLGYELGSREATVRDMHDYLAAVDEASDDVSVGSFGTSTEGRPLEYALVGDPADVAAAQEASAVLRDPATTPEEAAEVAATAPAIVWMAANVHGNEPSGGDAALVMLRDLADRTDCAARLVRDETVTVIIPTQNPDARVIDQRRNTYGFDLNRDWFARTQAETDGKLDLLADYPPVLMSDNHEMGGRSFFFPPNADPIHHEVADRSVRWINRRFGGAMADWFDREDWSYFNYSVYDLLYMGYGDSVPTTQLNAASMTYEKGGSSPIAVRTRQQFGATFASMFELASDKATFLTGLAASYRQAAAEGARGELEPNAVFAPGSDLQLQVPDQKVRHYFLRDTPATATELQHVVHLLQQAGVEVDRLAEPVEVPDFRPYAEGPRRVTLPAGTWHVSMAQGQKHWVQAMLGEDSYVPFPYFYDVTAWSLPLLGDLDGGRSGRDLDLVTAPAPPVGEPAAPAGPTPRIGLLKLGPGIAAYESQGWTRWLLDQKWQVDYVKVRRDSVGSGGLDDVDVLLVPGGNARLAAEAMGRAGRRALVDWVADGGRYVGWRGGTSLAIRLGLTTARLEQPTSDVPGSLLRTVGHGTPLVEGVGRKLFTFYEYDTVMTTPRPRSVAVSYPRGRSFFVSGFARRAGELRGTAAVVAEKYADGRTVLFAGDPNFRAFTTGTQKLVWNAITVADPAPRAPDASRVATAGRVRPGGADPTGLSGRGILTVPASLEAAALRAAGTGATATPLPGGLVRVSWPVPDVDGRSVLAGVLARMGSARDQVVAARVP